MLLQISILFHACIDCLRCILLGMSRNLRPRRPAAGFFEESDDEIIFSSVDDSDLDFEDNSNEEPAETLDRYLFIVRFFACTSTFIFCTFSSR